MTRSSISGAGDLPRYLWERSGTRSLFAARPSSVDEAQLDNVANVWSKRDPAPALSICIPTRDRLDLLVPCLVALARTCANQPVELIIGDTGSAPETSEAYSRMGLEAVRIDGPFNFSRACNAMAEAARADVLLFLNSDTEAISSDWVPHLLELSGHEIVGAALVYPGTRRIQSAGIEVVRAGGWLQRNAYRPRKARGGGLALQNVLLGRSLDAVDPHAAQVMAVSGACIALSRPLFRELRGFDESFRSDLQDVDLCLRGRVTGSDVISRRDIVFSHRHAASRGRYPFPLDDWRRFVDRWGGELEHWRVRRVSPWRASAR